MSVYTVLYSIAHLVIIVNKSYFNQINIYITYLLQLFLEVFELTQLTGQTGGQTCDTVTESVQSTPADYTRKARVRQYIEKERKENRITSSYLETYFTK